MIEKNKNYYNRIILWGIITAIIIITSLIDLEPLSYFTWLTHDKGIHLVVFALFMVITQLLFTNLSLFKISLITFVLGMLIELLQALLTNGNRKFDMYDIAFNLLGVALGLVILLVYRGRTISNE